MKILIADDDLVPRKLLESALVKAGHEVIAVCEGRTALSALTVTNAPKMAILDWMMPGMDGDEVCRQLRQVETTLPAYIILLTAKDSKQEIVAGLESGANDYVTKPFDWAELHARLEVGRKVIEMQQRLATQVRELEVALAEIKQLKSLLPICAYCKKVRDDQNYWRQVEDYLVRRPEFGFSHGICPACWETHVGPQLAKRGISAVHPDAAPQEVP